MTHFIIAGLVLGVGYLLLVTVSMMHRCPACRGKRAVAVRGGFRPCKRCKGMGRTPRLGATLVHRALQEHAMPWVRDRIRDRIAARTGDDS
jgi:methylphosphotriester-DNA--protein-cysteine methyltransferase